MKYLVAVKETFIKRSTITVETDLDELRLMDALRDAEAIANRDDTPLSFFQTLKEKGIHTLSYDEGVREYTAKCGTPDEVA